MDGGNEVGKRDSAGRDAAPHTGNQDGQRGVNTNRSIEQQQFTQIKSVLQGSVMSVWFRYSK